MFKKTITNGNITIEHDKDGLDLNDTLDSFKNSIATSHYLKQNYWDMSREKSDL